MISLYCTGNPIPIDSSDQGLCDVCTKVIPMSQPRHIAEKNPQPTQLTFRGLNIPNTNPSVQNH